MSTGVKLIRDDRLTQKVDYAYASVADVPVRAIWVAGACPLDVEGKTVAVGDYAEQTHQVMRNLVTALDAAGASLTDVVKTTVYVASSKQDDLVRAWEVYRDYMGAHDVPSTLLGVTVLGYDDQLVEVEAVAVITVAPGAHGMTENAPGVPDSSGSPARRP
jgi:enamine deaminase RidA (YjgF/YER057c/UK114 family)